MSLAPEERPTKPAVDYILSGPTAPEEQDGDSQTTVIFCVDVSGSMCVSEPLPPGQRIKGGTQPGADVLAFAEGGHQRLPGEANTQYVSRLQCVQAAVESQILALQAKNPNVRVALVTFSSEVTVFGDGSTPPCVIAGDRLSNKAELESLEFSALKPISETAGALKQAVGKLEEGGSTALGPALCVSMAMLKDAKPGSKIVLCTDGLANTGVGAIEDCVSFDEVDAWYRVLATQAKESGMSISVVAIEGIFYIFSPNVALTLSKDLRAEWRLLVPWQTFPAVNSTL